MPFLYWSLFFYPSSYERLDRSKSLIKQELPVTRIREAEAKIFQAHTHNIPYQLNRNSLKPLRVLIITSEKHHQKIGNEPEMGTKKIIKKDTLKKKRGGTATRQPKN